MLCYLEPACEVSHWDGLQHIDNPEEHPFYHVIPDPNDSLIAFGRERAWRYVCEKNLEPCPMENRNIDVDLAPEWIYNSAAGVYIPPDDLVFRHGGQLNDDGVTENCLKELKVCSVQALSSCIFLLFFSVSRHVVGGYGHPLGLHSRVFYD
jgi:hypothetical protein